MRCNICNSTLGAPIYESDSELSLTSLCELRSMRARVWSCPSCAHLRSDQMPDQAGYYASEYKISLGADDEDQIYEIRGDRIIYRTEHQVETLLGRLDLPRGALMLDYGCAKGEGPRQILLRRADVVMHLFDVSDMYRSYWDRFVPRDRTAVDSITDSWQGRFDVVTSFFAIEHMDEPQAVVSKIAALLKEGGALYGIVPDTFGNVADFVVTDHVNHFTRPSLTRLLVDCGFGDIAIDAKAHRGALVFTARKGGIPNAVAEAILPVRERSVALASFWKGLGARLRHAEQRLAESETAIYGAGFYGAWILSALSHPERIRCFLDRSPYQQGRDLFGKPVLHPDGLPGDVDSIYVGLNPAIARQAFAQSGLDRERPLEMVFIDGETT